MARSKYVPSLQGFECGQTCHWKATNGIFYKATVVSSTFNQDSQEMTYVIMLVSHGALVRDVKIGTLYHKVGPDTPLGDQAPSTFPLTGTAAICRALGDPIRHTWLEKKLITSPSVYLKGQECYWKHTTTMFLAVIIKEVHSPMAPDVMFKYDILSSHDYNLAENAPPSLLTTPPRSMSIIMGSPFHTRSLFLSDCTPLTI